MAKKRARVFFQICAIILSSALLTGCGADPARDDANYTAALVHYMTLLSEKAYIELYAMLTPESRAAMDEDSFLSRHNNIYGDIGAKSIRVEITGIEKLDTGRGSDRLGGRRVSYHMSMDTVAGAVELDNAADIYAYRISGETVFLLDWDAHVIFPNLTADRPVRLETVKARRGSVYDRNGVLLAGDGIVKSVGLVPGKMSEDRENDIRRIAEILGMTEAEILEKLSAKWVKDDVFVPLSELSEDDALRKELLLQIPGIRIDDKTGRVYPYGEEIAREAEYIDVLRGVDGRRILITDARGEMIEVLAEKPVVHGEDVYLDIDVMANP